MSGEWYEIRIATTPGHNGAREITWCRRDTEAEARDEASTFSKDYQRPAIVVRCTVVTETEVGN
jgi:hypothetical protein